MRVEARLAETLDVLARVAAAFEAPWWIIGSAAAVLVGIEDEVADVDLLASEADARRFLGRRDYEPPVPCALFRSAVFGRLSIAPLPIEIMARLLVRGEPLLPATRREVPWGDAFLYVPDIAEQVAILERFGRDKDQRRAERLRALSSAEGPSGSS